MAATAGVNPSLTNVLRGCQGAFSAGEKCKYSIAAVFSSSLRRESIV